MLVHTKSQGFTYNLLFLLMDQTNFLDFFLYIKLLHVFTFALKTVETWRLLQLMATFAL